MDLKLYYQKIRETEEKIAEPFPVLISSGTPDGGKAGTLTEVPKRIAAKMIVDGKATQAPAAQAEEFRKAQEAARAEAETAAAATRMQVKVISQADLDKLSSKQGRATK